MRKTINFNENWQFERPGESVKTVSIPHTIRLEKLDEDRVLRCVTKYKKSFELDLKNGQRAFIEFEGVMTTCKVYVNGKFAAKHEGGYTPFVIDITEFLNSGVGKSGTNVKNGKGNSNGKNDAAGASGKNELTVIVDNREKRSVPPGRPVHALDFLYYSGIYRNVNLAVVENTYITNAVFEGITNGGGIVIETKQLEKDTAKMFAKVHVKSGAENEGKGVLKISIEKDDKICFLTETELKPIVSEHYHIDFVISDPKLWSPSCPELYIFRAEIWINEKLVDCVSERFGIRTAEVKNDGFYLNGEKLFLDGSNRHQQYPYLGIAASDEAQFRDAYKLKKMGVNILRLSHYPHSKSFYDACDELGIIVISQVPGWQYSRYGKFRRLSIKNIQDMMRRDRNHACHIFMETGLNETVFLLPGATDKFFSKLVDVCKAEGSIITYGSPHGRKNWYAVDYDMISAYWDEKTKTRPAKGFPDRKCMIPEYGDFEYGGFYSTSRADRADGERASMVQAWNFQWAYNQNLKNPDALGCCTWEGIDHVRGYDRKNPISKSGMFDIFRRPKFVYGLYASQNDLKTDDDAVLMPSVFDYSGQEKIVFYSNLDKVVLYDASGKLTTEKPPENYVKIAEKAPDSGNDCDYVSSDTECEESVLYWTKNGDYIKSSQKNGALARHALNCLFDGGNCTQIKHPPFTFSGLPTLDSIVAIGYSNGVEKKCVVLNRKSEPTHLKIEIDYSGKPLVPNDNDFVFVHVSVHDKFDTLISDFSGEIMLQVQNGSTVFTDKITADAGIASFLVKANKNAKEVFITAKSTDKARDLTLSAKDRMEIDLRK